MLASIRRDSKAEESEAWLLQNRELPQAPLAGMQPCVWMTSLSTSCPAMIAFISPGKEARPIPPPPTNTCVFSTWKRSPPSRIRTCSSRRWRAVGVFSVSQWRGLKLVLFLLLQASLNKLMETLGQSEPYFVKCIRSNADKVLCVCVSMCVCVLPMQPL